MTRPSGTPALALLQARGVAHTVHTYAIDEPSGAAAHRGERTPYGVAAAAALGVSPARLFKTLVLVLEGGRAGGELVLAVVPSDATLSERAVAQALAAVAHRLVVARQPAVVADAQLHPRPRQRQRAQPFLDVAQLGAFGAQEAAARRHVVEQVAHFDGGADRMRMRLHRRGLAAVDLQARAVRLRRGARTEREAADGSDGRQGLAATASSARTSDSTYGWLSLR